MNRLMNLHLNTRINPSAGVTGSQGGGVVDGGVGDQVDLRA
jgi:hypothetical protein